MRKLQQKYLRLQLSGYLDGYIMKKDLEMKNHMITIRDLLNDDEKISINQFYSIIKFIERENEFRHMNQEEIKEHFYLIIRGEVPKSIPTGTLEDFI